jgi:hypothetical protein
MKAFIAASSTTATPNEITVPISIRSKDAGMDNSNGLTVTHHGLAAPTGASEPVSHGRAKL